MYYFARENASHSLTGLQLVLAMARNLSICISHKIETKGANKGLKLQQKNGQKGEISVLISAHVERVSVSSRREFLDGFPELVKLCFHQNIKTASSFLCLAPHHLPGLTPLIGIALRALLSPVEGEGNENREVEKVEVEGRRAREKRRIGEEEEGGGL